METAFCQLSVIKHWSAKSTALSQITSIVANSISYNNNNYDDVSYRWLAFLNSGLRTNIRRVWLGVATNTKCARIPSAHTCACKFSITYGWGGANEQWPLVEIAFLASIAVYSWKKRFWRTPHVWFLKNVVQSLLMVFNNSTNLNCRR